MIGYTKLVCNALGKYHYNFTIFLSLGNFLENIYNGKLSLEATKIKQRNMENMIRKLNYYNPNKEKYKTEKTNTLLNVRKFYEGIKMILIAFESGILQIPRQYPSDMHDWKEDEIRSSKFLPAKKKSSIPLLSQCKEWTKIVANEFSKLLVGKDKSIKKEVFKKHFGF